MICSNCTAPICLDGPDGSTALHAAIWCHERGKRKNLVMILIEAAKRFPISKDAPSNRKGKNALHLALLENDLDVVEVIILEDPAYQLRNASKTSDLKFLSRVAAEEGSGRFPCCCYTPGYRICI
ncbi:hypothetical protein POM88_011386 [Heracleum sosnowskyi]|uniref:Uncharacterized protein n=1 Tax=Heracleum sosnowskyi TaxID=360622 RepID=A0AAD8IUU5_9APIA|nr:hypothetical protein POM88_011386 [Heracleum sosnowskyi]